MLTFTQATTEDILSIDPQLPQCDSMSLSHGRAAFEQELVPLKDRAIAIHYEYPPERCIGAYGLIEMWHGVGRLWAIFSEELLADHAKVLAFHAKRDMKRADELGLHRIEATCDPSHDQGCRFLEWLGFEREGLMRRYSPEGTDSVLYARVIYEL